MTFHFSTSAFVVFFLSPCHHHAAPLADREVFAGQNQPQISVPLLSNVLWAKHRYSLSRNTRIYRLLTSLKTNVSGSSQTKSEIHRNPSASRRKMSTGWAVSLFAVAACLLSTASFAAGRHSVRGNLAHGPSSAPDPFVGEAPETAVLGFNKPFTESSARTARAWKEAMLPRGGFFDYPAVGEGRATFSVYH